MTRLSRAASTTARVTRIFRASKKPVRDPYSNRCRSASSRNRDDKRGFWAYSEEGAPLPTSCRPEPMRRPIRLPLVVMLLVAFLVTGLVPAVGSWSCPDGTACVYTAGRGFHCAGDECRMACCMGKKPSTRAAGGHGCGHCDHAGVPMAAVPLGQQRPTVGEPAHCQYHQAPQVEKVPAVLSAPLDLQWRAVAALPTPVVLPGVRQLFIRFAPVRGSPPSRYASIPCSPRAPPGLHCA
jgi:hypothetical protein